MNKDNLIQYFEDNNFQYEELVAWKEAYLNEVLPFDSQILEIKNLIWFLLKSSGYGMIEDEIDDAIEAYKSTQLAKEYPLDEEDMNWNENDRIDAVNKMMDEILWLLEYDEWKQSKLKNYFNHTNELGLYVIMSDSKEEYFFDKLASMDIEEKEEMIDFFAEAGLSKMNIVSAEENNFSEIFLKDLEQNEYISDEVYQVIEDFMFPCNSDYSILKIWFSDWYKQYIEPCEEWDDYLMLRENILENAKNMETIQLIENISIYTGEFLKCVQWLQLWEKFNKTCIGFIENQNYFDLKIHSWSEYIHITDVDYFLNIIIDIQLFFTSHRKKDIQIELIPKKRTH